MLGIHSLKPRIGWAGRATSYCVLQQGSSTSLVHVSLMSLEMPEQVHYHEVIRAQSRVWQEDIQFHLPLTFVKTHQHLKDLGCSGQHSSFSVAEQNWAVSVVVRRVQHTLTRGFVLCNPRCVPIGLMGLDFPGVITQ